MITTSDLRKELANKEKYISDLVRFIKTRTDNNPNYSLLLGAGCSVTSGIKSASSLIDKWRHDIYLSYDTNKEKEYNKDEAIEYLRKYGGRWYNTSNEYSSLFEKKYDLPRQRRMFVEQEVSQAKPSIGYAYLTKLVENTFFNALFTTNFDDLVNEAFYLFSNTRPIVCAHDSGISSITITSKRPKIIKLHGDYLFDDIKSTLRETESLEVNMKNKFIEFAKDYGLIVVGYSGQDRSIMDVLTYLLKQDEYYKNGIYWCLRSNSEIPEDLRKLLWRERAYYVVIDGFDELLAKLNSDILRGNLPISTSIISNQANETISNFITNKYLINSSSNLIQHDLEKLKKIQSTDNVYEQLKKLHDTGDSKSIDDRYTDQELETILNIQDLFKKDDYASVVSTSKSYLSSTKCSIDAKVKILHYIYRAYIRLGNYEKASAIQDELLGCNKCNPKHYLEKASVTIGYEEKLDLINKAIKRDPYYFEAYLDKALLIKESYPYYPPDQKQKFYNEIIETLDKGIKCYPDDSNPCWTVKFDTILKYNEEKSQREKELNKIIDNLSDQKNNSLAVIKLRLEIAKKMDKNTADQIIKDILDEKEKSYSHNLVAYDEVLINAYSKFNRISDLETTLKELELSEQHNKDGDFLFKKADIVATKFGKLIEAIDILNKSYLISKTSLISSTLIMYYNYLGNFDKAEEILEQSRSRLKKPRYIENKAKIKETRGLYTEALSLYESLSRISNNKYNNINNIIYIHMLQSDWSSAKRAAKQYLDHVKFNLNSGSEIVNYELCCKKLLGKINLERVKKLKQYSDSKLTKAACCALADDFTGCFDYLKQEMEEDKTSCYVFRNWPILKEVKDDPKFAKFFAN